MVLPGDKTLQDLYKKVKYEYQNVILKETVYYPYSSWFLLTSSSLSFFINFSCSSRMSVVRLTAELYFL